MTESNPTITLDIPGMIDGDPGQVEKRVLSQLPEVIDAFAEYFDGAIKQLANAERTRVLRDEPSMSPENLATAYDNSERAKKLALMERAAKVLAGTAADL